MSRWTSKTHRLAKGLRVQFVATDGALTVVWDPSPPAQITGRLLRRYRAARDTFIAELGTTAAVVELHEGHLEAYVVEPAPRVAVH